MGSFQSTACKNVLFISYPEYTERLKKELDENNTIKINGKTFNLNVTYYLLNDDNIEKCYDEIANYDFGTFDLVVWCYCLVPIWACMNSNEVAFGEKREVNPAMLSGKTTSEKILDLIEFVLGKMEKYPWYKSKPFSKFYGISDNYYCDCLFEETKAEYSSIFWYNSMATVAFNSLLDSAIKEKYPEIKTDLINSKENIILRYNYSFDKSKTCNVMFIVSPEGKIDMSKWALQDVNSPDHLLKQKSKYLEQAYQIGYKVTQLVKDMFAEQQIKLKSMNYLFSVHDDEIILIMNFHDPYQICIYSERDQSGEESLCKGGITDVYQKIVGVQFSRNNPNPKHKFEIMDEILEN